MVKVVQYATNDEKVFETCLCEGCPKQFTNDIDMDKKIRKRKVGMAKGMC
jgi:hypothetical protein